METIRSSLDIAETKHKIVNIIGKTLNSDRCFVMDYDQENDKFMIVEDEYLASKKIKQYKAKLEKEVLEKVKKLGN